MSNDYQNWQLCPKCNGEKMVPGRGTPLFDQCNVCNGAGIISQATGLPPQGYIPFTRAAATTLPDTNSNAGNQTS